jgi:uroporphyrinogen decarboxylase
MFGLDEQSPADQIEKYLRLVDECDWAAVPGPNPYEPEAIHAMKSAIGDRALVPGFEGSGVFWMPGGRDIMDFVVRLFEAPDDLHAEARRKCDQAKRLLRAQSEAGADFFVFTYDFGFNEAPFISPHHFRSLVAPYLTELVETAHDLGKRVILHSDGCLTEILDQLFASGIDGYQSVDPQGHMDIRLVREQYPDWLLMGNVECRLLQADDEEQIRASVRYCMTHGGIGKRYIFSTSNCIFHGMPVQSYRRMLDEYQTCISRAVEVAQAASPGERQA